MAIPGASPPSDARDLLRRISEESPYLIAALDASLRFLTFNDAYRAEFGRIFGVDIELGADLLEAARAFPDEGAKAAALWRRALGGEEFEVVAEFAGVRQEGRFYEITFRTLRDADGRPAGAYHFARDVTQREEALAEVERLNRELEERVAQRTEDLSRLVAELQEHRTRSELERERLRSVLEVLPVGVWIADASGRFLERNTAAREIWGETAPSSEGASTYERDYRAWWPDGRRVSNDEWALARALRDGEVSVAEELEIEARDGTRKSVLNYALPLRGAEGEIVGGVAVNVDVTDRRRAEEELRRSEEIVRRQLAEIEAIYDAAPVGLGVVDRDLRFVHVNHWLARMNGLAAEAHIGKKVDEVVPALAAQVTPMLRRVLETGEPIWDVEVPEDPSAPLLLRRYRQVRYHPLRLEPGGSVMGVNVTVEDITETKREGFIREFFADISKVLASSLDYEETLQRVARTAIPFLADYCIVDVVHDDGRVERAAGAHAEPGMQALLDHARTFPPVPDSDSVLARVLRTGEPVLVPDASDLDLQTTATGRGELVEIIRRLGPRSFMSVPLQSGERTLGSLLIVSTRGDRRYGPRDLDVALEVGRRAGTSLQNARLHAAEQRARQEAERASLSKSQFLATMSHELRTPLNAVVGYVDLMEGGSSGPLSETQLRYLGRIRSSAWHLVTIINEILSFARIEAGAQPIHMESVEIRSLLDECRETFETGARAKGLALVLEAAPLDLWTDSGKLRQILLNLVGNAVKFTDAGTVTLTLTRTGGEALIQVRDTGPGIPPEQLDTIFEPFTQADSSTTRSKGGTGLGLSVSRRLAELLGGTLSVESAPGEGSVFTLRLPLASEGSAEPGPS